MPVDPCRQTQPSASTESRRRFRSGSPSPAASTWNPSRSAGGPPPGGGWLGVGRQPRAPAGRGAAPAGAGGGGGRAPGGGGGRRPAPRRPLPIGERLALGEVANSDLFPL